MARAMAPASTFMSTTDRKRKDRTGKYIHVYDRHLIKPYINLFIWGFVWPYMGFCQPYY